MNDELELEEAASIDADKMRAMLRKKFPPEQYAMLYEVRDAAGFSARRNADVIVVGLWPSRGCAVEGMEIKISRGDWLRELKKPQKAEAFVRFCDRWWVIAADQNIVKVDELPPTWGLMAPRGNGLGILRQAPDLKPESVDRMFLAAMMKRAVDTAADSPEVRARIDARVEEIRGEQKRRVDGATAMLQREKLDLENAIAKFEEASGVRIDAYRGEQLGAAVKMVLAGEHKWRLNQMRGIKRTARDLLDWLNDHVPDAPEGEDGT